MFIAKYKFQANYLTMLTILTLIFFDIYFCVSKDIETYDDNSKSSNYITHQANPSKEINIDVDYIIEDVCIEVSKSEEVEINITQIINDIVLEAQQMSDLEMEFNSLFNRYE